MIRQDAVMPVLGFCQLTGIPRRTYHRWPAWGHRKICALMAAGGHRASVSTAERAMRRRGLLQPVDYQGQRRELARARKAAFADPPIRFRCALRAAPGSMRMAARMLSADVGPSWLCETVH